MSNLHARLRDLASTFADDVLAAVRTASLDELTSGAPRGPARPRAQLAGGGGMPDPLGAKPRTTKGGRLARRSSEDIQKTLGLVVAALKGTKGKGMRAEEIRKFLNLDVREVPRVLAEGLMAKKLRSKGQRRGTTYFAA